MKPLEFQSCPPALVVFARQRFAEWSTGYDAMDDRPWYIRWLLGPVDVPDFPPCFIEIRIFSNGDFENLECAGHILGCWIVDNYRDRDSITIHNGAIDQLPGIHIPETDMLATYSLPVFLNCALSDRGDKCIMVEIDVIGRVRRAVYGLAEGVGSKELGPSIGPVKFTRMQRDAWDTCLPPGWQPNPDVRNVKKG